MKTLIERVEYFQKLWAMLFPTTKVEDQQIVEWLISSNDAELEIVISKAVRAQRREPNTDLHKYITVTLSRRRIDAAQQEAAMIKEGAASI
jgi:hypothetical protein